MTKKKILAIVLAAVILCGAGVGIGFGIYNSRPENVAIQSIANTITEFGEREEIYPIASMLKQGSLEASMTKLKSDGESLIGDASVSGKLYFSPDAFAAEDIKFKYNDIKINADAYISRDIIYVSENEILDGEYGIDLSNPSKLAEELEDSIFAPGSKSGYEIPEEIFDPIIEILENLDPDAIEKDFNQISETYVKQLWKIICEHSKFEAERDNVRVGGEKISARIVTITVTSDALYDIISDFYDFMLDDELIIDFLDTHCEGIESAFEDMLNGDSVSEYYIQALESLEEFIDEAKNLDDYFDDVTIEIVTPKHKARILKLEVSLDGEKLATLDVGKDGIKDSKKISFEFGSNGPEIVYEVKQSDRKKYEAVVEVDGDSVAEILYNRSKEKFEISLGNSEYSELVIEGSLVKSRNTYTLRVSDFVSKYDGQTQMSVTTDLTLVIKTKDKMPSVPKDYYTISDIDEKDIEAWIEKIHALG